MINLIVFHESDLAALILYLHVTEHQQGVGGSGFSSGVSEVSHYRQGKSAALSPQSWPRSLLFVVANTNTIKAPFQELRCVWCRLLTWQRHFITVAHPNIYHINSSIWIKYALLYCCWWLEVLGEPVIQLCTHSRNHDHSLAVCFFF